jgi:hypothetical protein
MTYPGAVSFVRIFNGPPKLIDRFGISSEEFALVHSMVVRSWSMRLLITNRKKT